MSHISVFYKTVGNLKLPLQVYLPDNFDKTKKYKTVIAIHGGAWHSLKETPADWNGGWMAGNVKYYAKKGYVGIVFSYRDLDFEANGDVDAAVKILREKGLAAAAKKATRIAAEGSNHAGDV